MYVHELKNNSDKFGEEICYMLYCFKLCVQYELIEDCSCSSVRLSVRIFHPKNRCLRFDEI